MRAKYFMIFIFISLAIALPVHADLGKQSFNKANFSESAADKVEMNIAETEFSNPGLLPNSPFYPLKRLGEGLQLLLASEKEKPLMHLNFARKRIAEAKKMTELNLSANQALDDFSREINESGSNDPSVKRVREDVLNRSTMVLSTIIERLPEKARPAIERAMNNSMEKTAEIRAEKGVPKEITISEVRHEIEKTRTIERKEMEQRGNSGDKRADKLQVAVKTPLGTV